MIRIDQIEDRSIRARLRAFIEHATRDYTGKRSAQLAFV